MPHNSEAVVPDRVLTTIDAIDEAGVSGLVGLALPRTLRETRANQGLCDVPGDP